MTRSTPVTFESLNSRLESKKEGKKCLRVKQKKKIVWTHPACPRLLEWWGFRLWGLRFRVEGLGFGF